MSDPVRPNFAALLARLSKPTGTTDAELQDRDRLEHEALQASLLGSRMADWGIGPRERAAILAKGEWLEPPAVKHVLWMLAHHEVQSMVLWGGRGCGKSVAAALWLSRAARRPIRNHVRLGDTWEWDTRAKFVSHGDIARRYGSFDTHDKQWADDVRRCSTLVLDDLGGAKLDVSAHVADIVYERNRFELKTLITTNLTPEAFSLQYDGRSSDRLTQDGYFRACGSENLRRGAA